LTLRYDNHGGFFYTLNDQISIHTDKSVLKQAVNYISMERSFHLNQNHASERTEIDVTFH
jgi:hypothetical protein